MLNFDVVATQLAYVKPLIIISWSETVKFAELFACAVALHTKR